MTAQTGYMFPTVIQYQHPMAGAITSNPLQLPPALTLVDPEPHFALFGVKHKVTQPASQTFSQGGYLFPGYGNDLFNHWLLVPARLDMGNLLTNQARNVEVANMFFTAQDIDTVVNSGGGGISLSGVPSLPHTVNPFDSIVLSVSISADGAPNINGTIDFTFGGGAAPISLPLTGTRITLFPWQPDIPVTETLEWTTDVMISANDTEQRASILLAARQRIRMSVAFDTAIDWQRAHNVLFDWMPRVFGIPIWWEQRPLSAAVGAGQDFLPCDTNYGDFREGGLVMIINTVDGTFEAFEIDTFTGTQINLTSLVQNDYAKTAMVMPVRSGYLSSTPNGSRKLNNFETLSVEFLTLDNVDLSDTTGAATLNGLVLFDDPNACGDSLAETWSRDITVIDGKSGRVFQTTLIDRSRIHTKKGWALNSLQDTWRVRRLLHSFKGNFNTFYLPTFRTDFTLSEDITGGATSFRVTHNGYTQFIQSRAPMNYVRLLFNDGTYLIRQITGSSEDDDEEVIQILSTFSGTLISRSLIHRMELVVLMRIEDDKATFDHSSAGVSDVTINVVSTKG